MMNDREQGQMTCCAQGMLLFPFSFFNQLYFYFYLGTINDEWQADMGMTSDKGNRAQMTHCIICVSFGHQVCLFFFIYLTKFLFFLGTVLRHTTNECDE